MNAPQPVVTGLRLRCPQCGKGRLFQSYLKFAPTCSACGADFRIADAGDGPAVFVMFLVGAIVVPLSAGGIDEPAAREALELLQGIPSTESSDADAPVAADHRPAPHEGDPHG